VLHKYFLGEQPYSEKNAYKPTPPTTQSAFCGEEISKGKLGSAIVTSEKTSRLKFAVEAVDFNRG
jgi:hypothetical protein